MTIAPPHRHAARRRDRQAAQHLGRVLAAAIRERREAQQRAATCAPAGGCDMPNRHVVPTSPDGDAHD